MPKKTFKGNPALQFITATGDDQDSGKPTRAEPEPPHSEPEEPPRVTAPQHIRKSERRPRRVQLVMQPSVYERIKEYAAADGNSLNDYIHLLLEEEITRKDGNNT